MTLYDDLGGAPAVKAALDSFYTKVLADEQLNYFFDGIDIEGLKETQSSFFAMAMGAEGASYQGRSLRDAHQRVVSRGLDDELFDRFVGHFEIVMQEFGVDQEKIGQVMTLVRGARSEVLNR